MQTIKEPTLRELAEAQSLSGVVAVGQSGGYVLSLRYGAGDGERLLATARGTRRVFSSLNTLALFLQRLGITRFEVDSVGYVPARVRAPRPDRARALRRTRTRPLQDAFRLAERTS